MKADRIINVKVGIFDPYLETLGGGEKYILNIALCLAEKHEVFLFWDDDLILEKAHFRFNLNLDRINLTKNIFSPGVNILKKRQETKKYDLIIYISDGSVPLLFAKKNILLFQFPVNWVNGDRFLTKIKLNRIDKIICYSNYVKKHLDKTFKANAFVLNPAADVIPMYNIKKENVILSVGRFTKAINTKKQEVLVKVFKENYRKIFSNWKLIIIGSVLKKDREYLFHLRKIAGDHPIEVHDSVSYEQLKKYYQRSKIYWHAAGYGEDLEEHPEFAEHFGISTVEAMGAGAVPVVINAGGQKEIVEDQKSGFLWNSLDELRDKTSLLINDEKLLKSISREAKKRAELFSGDRFCKELFQIIDI